LGRGGGNRRDYAGDRRSPVQSVLMEVCGMKRKKLVALFLATMFALAVAGPASADKPKFNPNDNACQGPNDQNNCPGGPH
jgi:hypothetical protein